MSSKAAKAKTRDPDGDAWFAASEAAWAKAVLESPEDPMAAYERVPLPDWEASRPAGVTRKLLGRYLLDRDTSRLHDVYEAMSTCAIDAIQSATFFHFFAEVPPDLEFHADCMGAG